MILISLSHSNLAIKNIKFLVIKNDIAHNTLDFISFFDNEDDLILKLFKSVHELLQS